MASKRTRRFAPKSRAGCRTCKSRKVKCDEQRPACQRCLVSGRRCQGYSDDTASAVRTDGTTVIWIIGSTTPCSDLQEQAGFQSFLTCCVRDLAGSFGQDLWLYLTPQLTWDNAVVRHAVVALGAGAASQAQEDQPNCELSCFAAGQYAIALKLLRTQLASDPQRSKHLSTLLACLLFATFELQRRAHEEAEQHLLGGLQILRLASTGSRSESPATAATRSERNLLQQLRAAFERLDLQFSFYNSTRIRLITEAASPSDAANDRPLTDFEFNDVPEAEHSLNACLRSMRVFMYDAGVAGPKAAVLSPHAGSPPRPQQAQVLLRLARWDVAMKLILPTLKSDRDLAIAALLQTHQISAVLMVNHPFSDRASFGWERSTTLFRELIEKAKHFITYTTSQDAKETHGFGLEMGVIPPLYLTLLRCEDAATRREALQLLKEHPHREGIWDGPSLTTACERMLELDMASEDICGDIDCNTAHRRLCNEYFDVHTDRGFISYRRKCFEEDGRSIEFRLCVSDDRSQQREVMRLVHQHALACYEQGVQPRKSLAD